jgi:hypothetical protein
MSSSLNNETFDGTYQDKLVKRLKREDRNVRRSIIGHIRDEFVDYTKRMGGEHTDFMHKIIGNRSVAHVIILEQKIKGTGQGRFNYLWYEKLAIDYDGRDPANKIAIISERSFSSSPFHYGFRHQARDGIIHLEPDLLGLQRMETTILPDNNYRVPTYADPFSRRLAHSAFIPEPQYGISTTEMFAAAPKLYEILGILASLGPETANLPHSMPEKFEDRLWMLRRLDNAADVRVELA